MRWIYVWDLPTRIFHWLLVICVAAAYLWSAGRPHGLQFLIHVVCGYAIILLLLFRFVWGFAGGEYARFGSFIRDWSAIKSYGASLLRFAPQRSIGHNPIAGWMIVLILLNLVLLVITGLLSQDVTGGTGPLTGLLSQSTARAIGGIHQILGSLILILAAIHLAGVAVESWLHRDNLARAMVTGRKPAAVPAETDARTVPAWRAIALLILLVALGAYMASVTSIPEAAPPRTPVASNSD